MFQNKTKQNKTEKQTKNPMVQKPGTGRFWGPSKELRTCGWEVQMRKLDLDHRTTILTLNGLHFTRKAIQCHRSILSNGVA